MELIPVSVSGMFEVFGVTAVFASGTMILVVVEASLNSSSALFGDSLLPDGCYYGL